MTTPYDKIARLERQIAEEKSKIKNCYHHFDKPFYNPEKQMVGYGYKTVGQGSDVWGDYEGYHEQSVDRWTRRCAFCGLEQHTYKQKEVKNAATYEPDF